MFKKSYLKFIILPVLIPIILVFIWFRHGLIMGGGEEGLYYYKPSTTLKLTQAWMEYGAGNPNPGASSTNTLFYPLAFLNDNLHIPNYILQAGVFLILLETGVISIFFLTTELLEGSKQDNQISTISALFYLLNPFSISQIWGRSITAQYFAFALLPAATLFFLLGLKKKKYIYAFILTLVSVMLSSAFGFISFVLSFWFVLGVTLIFWQLIIDKKNKNLFFNLSFFILCFVLWIPAHFWWLQGYIPAGGNSVADRLSSPEGNINSLVGVSRNFTPDLLIRLFQKSYFSPDGYYGTIYRSVPLQIISWLPPLFLVLGLIKSFKVSELKFFRFFTILLAIGLFISLGANLPFGGIFVWLFKNLFFLQPFRNPYEKFGLVYVLGYAPIFALGVVTIFKQKIKAWLGGFIVLLTCGLLVWPIWTGKIFAGTGDEVGVYIPDYYQQLSNFLDKNSADYRVFMTPLWGGDGAAYFWGNRKFSGSDPMMYLINQPSISDTLQSPYYYDLISAIRRNMDTIDVVPALGLLRTKYLVNRQDALLVSDYEKLHYSYLTDTIHPQTDPVHLTRVICQNLDVTTKSGDTAKLSCQIPADQQNWKGIRYLQLDIKTDIPAALDIAIKDKNEARIRWDGRVITDYQTNDGWTSIVIPLNIPYEYSYEKPIDLSRIYTLDLIAYQKNPNLGMPASISLRDIKLDAGRELRTGEYSFVTDFGKLSVFKPNNLNFAPEYGSYLNLVEVRNFPNLFEETSKLRESLDKIGFILPSQNKDKDLTGLFENAGTQLNQLDRFSNTRYWVQLRQNSKNNYLVLSKYFNPGWKVIKGVSKNEMDGSFSNDLKLLKGVVIPENQHYVVNGYANLWKVNDDGTEYAILFFPQLGADIASKVSVFSVLIIVGGVGIWWLKNFFFSRRNRSLDSI